MSTHYDSIVIGSGQSGSPLATALVNAGRKTALIESTHIGGCCVNVGCTPTKTMIASGRVAHLASRAGDYGIENIQNGKLSFRVDMEKVRQRKRDIVTSFRGGSESRLQKAGVDVITGTAGFQDSKMLSVKLSDGSERAVAADEIFINTGERPARPQISGLESVPAEFVLDSTSIQELREVPSHLIVIGGGYIGLEFGQLFRRLGSEVTIIQRGKQLLPREDADIAQAMLEILQQDGIKVHLQSNTSSIAYDSGSKLPIAVTTENNQGTQTSIEGSYVLFAAGRVPNTDMLNLDAAGIKTTPRGYITANEHLETSTPGIYALGDVKGPPAFTHISYDDFRVIKANVIDKAVTRTIANRIVPYVVYTDPQLGHVGLHEAEARKELPEKRIEVAKMPMAYVARARETDETRGMMKAIVEADSGKILGFTCLGMEGGEIMSVVQMAMLGNLPWQSLRDAVFAHPTLAESLNNLWGFLE